MMRNTIIGGGSLVAALVLYGFWGWWGVETPRPVETDEVPYICTETKEVVRGPAQPVPAVNPNTGRRTLVRAVYAPQQHKWVAAPSEEVLRQMRRKMASTTEKSPLKLDVLEHGPDE